MPDNKIELIIAARDQFTATLNQLTSNLTGVKGVAEQSFGAASAASENLISSLAGLVGITLTLGGAFQGFKKGIELIDEFNLRVVSNAAALTNLYAGPPEKATEAYGQFKAYVLDMYSSFTAEAGKHISSAKDLADTFYAFSRYGIIATQEQAGAVGILTDAVRILHGGHIDNQTVLHEIRGLLEGHAGLHFRLAEQVKQLLGPAWHEVVLEHQRLGDLIPWLSGLYKGLQAATSDVQKELLGQKTTLQGLISAITRGGLAGAYEDVVDVVARINDYLRTHKELIASNMTQAWERFRNAVKEAATEVENFKTAHPVLVDLGAILLKLTAYTMGVSTAVRAIKASWDWVSGGVVAAVGTITGVFSKIAGVVSGVVSQFAAVAVAAGETGGVIGAATGLGAAAAVAAIITMAGHIAARLTKMMVDWVASWEIAGHTVGDYCNLGLLYFQQFGMGAVSVIQGTVSTIERAWEEMTYVLKKGFLDVLSIGANLPVVGGAFTGFEGKSKQADQDHDARVVQINEHTALLNKQTQAVKDNLQAQIAAINNRKKAVGEAAGRPAGGAGKLPPIKSPDLEAPGGGGKGTEAAAGRMTSILDTLDKELAKLSSGSLAEADAWLKKMLDDIAKAAAKGVDGTAAEAKAYEVADAKKKKITEDFWLMVAKESGDAYAQIDAEYRKDLQQYQGIAGAKEQLDWIREKKRFEAYQNFQKEIEDLQKSSLQILAQNSPLQSQQLAIERQLLEVEIARGRADNELKMQKLLDARQINEAQANELRGLQALADASRRYSQERKEWATQGVYGGWKDFQANRWQEMETREATWMKEFLGRAEQWTAESIGQGIIDGIEGNQGGMQQALKGLLETGVKQIVTFNVQKLWDALAGKQDKSILSGSQQSAQILEQGGFACGQKIITAAQEAAGILGAVNLSGSGSPGATGGFGGRTDIYGEYLRSRGGAAGAGGGSAPGSIGGSGGGGGGGGEGGPGLSKYMAAFGRASGTLLQGAQLFRPAVSQFSGSGVPGLQAAGQAGQAAASMGMVSNLQLGLGAAGLGLGAIGLATGSQGLVTAGMVLQTAAVAIQIAAIILQLAGLKPLHTGGLVAHTGILVAHAGLNMDERLVKVQVGEGIIKKSTMAAYAGQGIGFDDLNEGRLGMMPVPVPVRFTNRGQEQGAAGGGDFHFHDRSTFNFTGSRADEEDFKRMLHAHKKELVDVLRSEHRNFVPLTKR